MTERKVEFVKTSVCICEDDFISLRGDRLCAHCRERWGEELPPGVMMPHIIFSGGSNDR